MQSEEEKYYLIDQFLKGKLSESEENVLKGSFSANEFLEETSMHQLANEAIEENYLLGIRAATKKVIKRNSDWQKGKWVAGTCLLAAGIIVYTTYSENEIKQEPVPFNNQLAIKNIVIKPNESTKSTIKSRSTIKPNKINQTTNLITPNVQPEIRKEEHEYISLPNPSLPDLKPEALTESQHAEIAKPDVKVAAPLVIPQEKKVSNKEMAMPQVDAKESIELILNPSRDEMVHFPLEEGFTGELILLDATGNILLKRQIHHGLPKEWDGVLDSGGKANPGQYVFVIRSVEGKEIKQGYITVLR